MTDTQEILYSIDAHIYPLAKDAAKEFARSHWAQPRKIRKWNSAFNTFEMVGGVRIYQIALRNASGGSGYGALDARLLWTITVVNQ